MEEEEREKRDGENEVDKNNAYIFDPKPISHPAAGNKDQTDNSEASEHHDSQDSFDEDEPVVPERTPCLCGNGCPYMERAEEQVATSHSTVLLQELRYRCAAFRRSDGS